MSASPSVFEYCHGVVPLRPRLEKWMVDLLSAPDRLQTIVEEYGAPINIQSDMPFRRNALALTECVGEYDVPFLPMFARKANKCLTYVDAARDLNIGIDTASHAEVQQCLAQGIPGNKIVCTAAVKDHALMSLCANSGVSIILDNFDELTLLEEITRGSGRDVSVGLRMNGFVREGSVLYSRFGFPLTDIPSVATRLAESSRIRLHGLHFHLKGYSAEDRIAAITQTLPLLSEVRGRGQDDFFLDIGGGIPMNYLDDANQWDEWVSALDAALLGSRAPITQHNDGLGRRLEANELKGSIDSYPVAQSLVIEDWIRKILEAKVSGQSIAGRMREERIALRCEPGRSLLDGCGMTVARVAFCKRDSMGTAVFGVQMNRTQSRSGFSEFALDPLMVPRSTPSGTSVEGYLAGTYCTESEWLSRRKMVFPHGVLAGDLMMFPNTAGYLMHFLESRSHQFPLAKNVFVSSETETWHRLDKIDEI